jgi:hypothetical protein
MNDGLLTSHLRSIDATPRDRVAAIANAMQRRPMVIVMGVSGSGASLCAHILSALGVDMVGPERGSGVGPWERAELVALHDRILALFNRAHLGPFHDFALPVAWWADPRVAGIKREIVAFLEVGMGAGYFGFKDPRAARLLPVWQQVANELKLAPRLVLCLRNPAQIAALSSARDGLDPTIAEYRWLANTVDFFRHANSFDICTVEYENWFEDPPANVTRLKDFLGLEWQQGESDLSLLVSGIIDGAAQGEEAGRHEPSQPLVRSLYKLARRADGDGGARDQIANIAFEFVGFQQLQRPFQLAFEEVAKAAAKFLAIEQELDALRTAGTAIEGEASGLRATLAERDAAIAQLSRQVDDLTTSLQSAQAERTAQEEAAQRAEQAVQQQVGSAEAMQGEIAALREALARAEQAAAAAEASRAEVAALREAMAAADHAAQERDAAVDAMQGEIAVLREALARTEQEAQRGEAAAAAMAAEFTIVRGALAQAEAAAQEKQVAAETARAEAAILHEALVRSELLSSDRVNACAAMQSEVSALQERLALGERERGERAVTRKALQRELAMLRQALKQAGCEAQQSADGTRAMRSEVVKLRNALAEHQEQGRQQTAAVKTFEAQVRSLQERLLKAEEVAVQSAATQSATEALRGALAQAEITKQERAAEAAVLKAEIDSLRDAVEAARQVGKVAMAALQISGEALPQPEPQQRHWRQVLRRLFGAVKEYRSGRANLVPQPDRG